MNLEEYINSLEDVKGVVFSPFDFPEIIIKQFGDFKTNNIFAEKYSFQKTLDIKKVRDMSAILFYKKIKPFYQSHKLNVFGDIKKLLGESLKNANFYSGNESHPLDVELLLTPFYFSAGICDGGVYFGREDVKRYWQSKKYHPEKTKTSYDQIGFGHGTQTIYSTADIIFVDNEKSKLYFGVPISKFSCLEKNL